MTEGPPTGPIEGDVAGARFAAAQVKNRDKTEVQSFDDLSRQQRRQREKDATQNRKLRLVYAGVLLLVMLAQIAAADWVFYLYGRANSWMIPPEAIQAWLAATVIEVIGVVVVITRFLFSKDAAAP